MILRVDRKYRKGAYTISNLTIDGKWVCNTIEDKDRGLHKNMSLSQIRNIKVKDMTAIPTGKYKITMNVVSPKFSKKKYYLDFCKGRLPRLLDVPGFDGILIHAGNLTTGRATAGMSSGCLLLGYNTEKGALTKTKECYEKVYKMLDAASRRKEEIFIVIGNG